MWEACGFVVSRRGCGGMLCLVKCVFKCVLGVLVYNCMCCGDRVVGCPGVFSCVCFFVFLFGLGFGFGFCRSGLCVCCWCCDYVRI